MSTRPLPPPQPAGVALPPTHVRDQHRTDFVELWRGMLAGDHLYYRTTKGTEAAIPLSRLSNVLIADETYRKTPGWAVVLAVLLFPIGLLFLLSKNDVPQSRITVYVKGNPPTPITFWRPVPGGNAQAEWYPALAAIGGSR